MKLYIYELSSMKVIDVIVGNSNAQCEAIAEERGYMYDDEVGATYSPAFGAVGGLNP